MSLRKYFLVSILIVMITGANEVEVLAQTRPDAYERHWRDSTVTVDRKINIIKANILAYPFGDYNIRYERLALHAPRSFVAKLDYYYYTSTEFDLWGSTIRTGFRNYFTKKRQPPAGYYVQPFFTYGEYKVRDKAVNRSGHVSQIGGGLIGGKQWAIGKRITIEVFLGGEYVNLTANYRVKGVIESFQPILGASTGFRF